jgi:hypothetical protein
LAEKLIHLYNTDATFRREFDNDPAAKLQDLVPELRKQPKQEIQNILNQYFTITDIIFSLPPDQLEPLIGGSIFTQAARSIANFDTEDEEKITDITQGDKDDEDGQG